jgi:uncharacterized protein (DUF1800 family)
MKFNAVAPCVLFLLLPHAGTSLSAEEEMSRAIHLINRLSYGPRPGDVKKVMTMGFERYLYEQLSPQALSVPPELRDQLNRFQTISRDAAALFAEYGPPESGDPALRRKSRRRSRIIGREAAEARFARALLSPRQLEERMVEFWFNHFNVSENKGDNYLWTGPYEQFAIRPHALGRFRDLLGATAKHPAMLTYLDNKRSSSAGRPGAKGKLKGLNENYARELMELHTLGVDGEYNQDDVVALAKILTGWGVGANRQGVPGNFFFNKNRHDFSDKLLLGHWVKGRGQEEGEEALDILARHPSTARFISRQLAQYFISDDPPPREVERLAEVFRSTDGNIRAVLEALFRGESFWAPGTRGAKFKTPYHYLISCFRSANINALNINPSLGFLRQMGMPLYRCATPDGYKSTEAAWLNGDAILKRIAFSVSFASGHSRCVKATRGTANEGDRKTDPRVTEDMVRDSRANQFSPDTLAAVNKAEPRMRAAALLGSPDMMRY